MYTYMVGHASQQGSCDAVPLLCGGLAVQGASPYNMPQVLHTTPTKFTFLAFSHKLFLTQALKDLTQVL